jgi:predicted acylesterase/phospholipase RssA
MPAAAEAPHLALVLQGGAALGAYEAGVLKALLERQRDASTSSPVVRLVR